MTRRKDVTCRKSRKILKRILCTKQRVFLCSRQCPGDYFQRKMSSKVRSDLTGALAFFFPRARRVFLRSASDSFSVSVRFDTSQSHDSLPRSRTFSHPTYVTAAASRLFSLPFVPSPYCSLYSGGQMRNPHCPPEAAKIKLLHLTEPVRPRHPFPTYFPS